MHLVNVTLWRLHRDKLVSLTQRGSALSAFVVALAFLPITGCDSSDPAASDSGTGGSGGRIEDGTGGKAVEHEDLRGTGTECDPAEVCQGDQRGCTECPDTKVCVVNIISGASISVGGAGGEENWPSVTFLNHRCVDKKDGCEVGDCDCGQESYCGGAAACGASLPDEYAGVGNLSEVSAGATYCVEDDG